MVGSSLRSGSCHTRCFRSAFTLLEVLLASVLSATLLLTLWSLIGTYTSLFATGGAKTEQSQIARSLLQQMSDDLGSAIQDTATRAHLKSTKAHTSKQSNDSRAVSSPPTTETGGSPTDPNIVRHFGLFGTRHELRIDVLQIVPLEVSLAACQSDDGGARDPLSADEPHRRAPELRTVCYTFNKRRETGDLKTFDVMSTDDESSMEEALLGLVREEMDFETRNPAGTGTRLAGRLASRSADNKVTEQGTIDQFDAAKGEATESDIDARIDSGAVLWVPEVVGLEFRYFDGSGWTSQWDSIKRKSLPVAVEIRLEIESLDPRAVRRRAAAEAAGETLDGEVEYVGNSCGEDQISTDEIRLEDEQEASRPLDAEAEPPAHETYRLVVKLSSAKLHKGLNKQAAQARGALDRPQPLSTQRLEQSTLPTPQMPSSSKPPKDKNALEQWLRTNPQ